ncbi:hypothetical protein JAAARDRAFT_42560 [Jaapia argillacea MUCL 33604]|uniref:DNA polymerase epsilon subunit D n=1 Tax=Jaapia argillacea MUCL 33604 TaxID=933084 RepID=A0A067PGX6_9AGAM|nr:hypothetical protein JAAARDRAFT_42560 [Jaapia argillacea MUCL 33604]
MPRKDASSVPVSAQSQQDAVSEGLDNFELPKALVTKLAKSSLPENAKFQKEVVLSLLKGSTVFINYLAATAHDIAQSKQHKSVSASDVLKALELLEFGDMGGMLQSELQAYRDIQKRTKHTHAHTSASTGASTPAQSSAPTAVPSAKGKAKEVDGQVRPASVKGKGKNTLIIPPQHQPPIQHHHPEQSISTRGPTDEDAEMFDGDVEPQRRQEEEEFETEGEGEGGLGPEEEEDDAEDEEEEEGGEGEEEVDMMVVEDEEVRRDGKVLDGVGVGGSEGDE